MSFAYKMRNDEEKKQLADTLFLNYADKYDRSNGKIELKIIHTMETAKVMDDLANKLHLDEHRSMLAHVCAVYHDIGRFEQVKRYDTFLDHLSIDHAKLGVEVLQETEILSFLPSEEQDMIMTAIRNHNRYAIEDGITGDTLLLSKMIRDADKCDIFRVFACEELVDTMGETMEMVEQETVTDEVYESFMRHQCIEKKIRKTGLDKWVGFLAFFYDMNFEESIRLMRQKGLYRRQFDLAGFALEETRRKVSDILEELERYLSERTR